MKIGILGAGNVGGTLGTLWATCHHDVRFGVRDPKSAEVQARVKAAPGSAAVTSAEAVRFAEVVVLALPWDAVKPVVSGITGWDGKIVVDASNPLLPNLGGLAIGHTTSAGEQVAAWLPNAKVVKAFNTIGMGNVSNLEFAHGQRASGFLCGDDAAAKATVAKLATDLGFDAVDCGPLKQARLLEPLAMLWISMAYQHGHGPNIAFKLLRR